VLEKFKIGEYHVDVKRNQLDILGRTILLEPKVMDVLHHLALHQGEVVSQQELFEALWPNSLFSSGSVLRCIAQLRKALGDDAKKQSIIHTHPKRGYSLKLEVEQLTDPSLKKLQSSDSDNRLAITNIFSKDKRVVNKSAKSRFYQCIYSISFVLLGWIMWKAYSPSAVKTQFSELTPITSTQSFEYQPELSPVSDTVVFIRTDNGHQTHLWIKHLTTKKEYRLSKDSQEFLSLTWSSDGKAIAYISKVNSSFELGYFDLPKSLSRPLFPNVIYRFQSNKHIGSIQWGKNNHLYYLSYPNEDLVSTQATIHSVDLMTKTAHLIWQQNNSFMPYDMSLSPDNNTLALSGYGQSFQTDIKLLDLEDKSLMPLIANLPVYTQINWHPLGEYLLLTDIRELKLLSLKGDVQVIDWLNFRDIESPSFNTQGDKIALVLSMTDVDLLLQSVNDNNEVTTVANSNAIDSSADISPDGTGIVYLSENAGYQQVYLYHAGTTELLFANKDRQSIDSAPLWSNDGKTVLINLGSELLFIDPLTKKNHFLEKSIDISYVYAWYQKENALLVDYRSDTGITITKYNLDTNKLTPITSGNINYAHLVEDELVIIKDNSIVKVIKENELVLYKASDDQKIVASVSIGDGVLFQLNDEADNGTKSKELWQVDMKGKQATYLSILPTIFDKIIDVSADGSQRLFTTPSQQEKDIVVLE